MSERPYDVVLFGATGYTGSLVARALYDAAEHGLRFALAGRNRDKLEALVEQLSPDGSIPIIEASSNDAASISAMVSQTRVIITTVGPYARYGEVVVKAAVEHATHYLDLVGEPPWWQEMIDRYHDAAVEAGVRIVHSCGFDSVPYDLACLLLRETVGPVDEPVVARGYLEGNGGPSGGTLVSAGESLAQMKFLGESPVLRYSAVSDGPPAKLHRRPKHLGGGYALPFPTIDPLVVGRSAELLPETYGRFRYEHYGAMGGLLVTLLFGWLMLCVFLLVKFGPTRRLLSKMLPPGDGPPKEKREASHFRLRVVDTARPDGPWVEVAGHDPGYGGTARVLVALALALADPEYQSPRPAGVLTPATAFGTEILPALGRAGYAFSVHGENRPEVQAGVQAQSQDPADARSPADVRS